MAALRDTFDEFDSVDDADCVTGSDPFVDPGGAPCPDVDSVASEIEEVEASASAPPTVAALLESPLAEDAVSVECEATAADSLPVNGMFNAPLGASSPEGEESVESSSPEELADEAEAAAIVAGMGMDAVTGGLAWGESFTIVPGMDDGTDVVAARGASASSGSGMEGTEPPQASSLRRSQRSLGGADSDDDFEDDFEDAEGGAAAAAAAADNHVDEDTEGNASISEEEEEEGGGLASELKLNTAMQLNQILQQILVLRESSDSADQARAAELTTYVVQQQARLEQMALIEASDGASSDDENEYSMQYGGGARIGGRGAGGQRGRGRGRVRQRGRGHGRGGARAPGFSTRSRAPPPPRNVRSGRSNVSFTNKRVDEIDRANGALVERMATIALREQKRSGAPWVAGNAQAVAERRAKRGTSNGAIRRRKKNTALERENARIAKRLNSIRGGKRGGRGRGGGRSGAKRGSSSGSGFRAARAVRDAALHQPEWES